MRTRMSRRWLRPCCLVLSTFILLSGCVREPAEQVPQAARWSGPVVLISLASMRADAVSGLTESATDRFGPTPALRDFVDEADWAGPAVATSSFGPASLASALTGLPPWLHGVTDPGSPRMRDEVATLAELLRAESESSRVFVYDSWLGPSFGFAQGFSGMATHARLYTVSSWLRELEGGLSLTWIHLGSPRLPYVDPSPVPVRKRRPGDPEINSLVADELAPYLDPGLEIPNQLRENIQRLYGLNVSTADREVGRILAHLKRADRYDNSLIVVFGDNGEALGENGRVMHGYDLGPETLLVPLIVKLPRNLASGYSLAAPALPSTARIASTVLEIVGLEVPIAMAPPLSRPETLPALATLFHDNGAHRLAMVEEGRTLEFECRFWPPSSTELAARIQSITGRGSQAWQYLRQEQEAMWVEGRGCDPLLSDLSSWGRAPAGEGNGREWLLALLDEMSDPRVRKSTRPLVLPREEEKELRVRGFPVLPGWFRNSPADPRTETP